MFRKKAVTDKKLLVLVRLIEASTRFLVFLALFGQVWNIIPWNTLQARTDDEVLQSQEIDENQVIDENPSMYPSTTDSNFDYGEIGIIDEVDSLRSENTKTFRRADGSYVVSIYSDAVHYYKNGNYENIDNTLEYDSKNGVYKNKSNAYSIKLPKSLNNEKTISLNMGEYGVNWTVVSDIKSEISVDHNEIKANNLKEMTNISKRVIYDNVLPDVSLEYFINGNSIKENIILETYRENFEITFLYSLKNLDLIEDNERIFFVNNEGEEIFDFSRFFAIDQKNNETNQVDVSVVEIKKNTYEITVSVDNQWLKSASYPVVIDPTINSLQQAISIYDTYVSESNPDTNYYSSPFMILSNTTASSECQGLLYFVMPYQVMDKQITYATLTLSRYGTASMERTIALYKNNTSFASSSVKWNNKPTTSPDMTDYHVVKSSSEYVFNITKAVREWQTTGSTSTTGFTIRDKEYYGAYNAVRSKEYSGTLTDPVIEIGYINPAGIKDYWTYNAHSIGEYSTGYISDFTGQLSIIRNDLTFSTDKQMLSLGFGYNLNDRTVNIGYHKGWNIIYNKKVLYDSFLGLYYTKDYTGNEVYYHETSCDSRFQPNAPLTYYCYIAEDGSGNMLARTLSSGTLINFHIRIGNDIVEMYNTSGYLTSIENESTNQALTIIRNVSNPNLVTRITDGSGNRIENTYSSGILTKSQLYIYQGSSTAAHLLEEVTYAYASKGDGTGNFMLTVTYKKRFDLTQSMATDEILFYDYDSNGRILSTYIGNDEKIIYTYNSTTNRVQNVTSYYGSAPYGTLTYDYGLKETTITDQNDVFINYKFDDFGHTINVLDMYGNVQFYRYCNLFQHSDVGFSSYLYINGEPNYYQNNKLISQSTPQSNLFNPINNGGFEFSSMGIDNRWMFYNDTGDITDVNYSISSQEEALFGFSSAYIKADSANTGHYEQKLLLDEGVYTLSGYIKNLTTSNQVWIDVLGEDYGGVVNYVSPSNTWKKTAITFGINNDDTEVTIKLINHGNGKAYFDAMELFNDFVDNRLNMMDNASFEIANNPTSVPGWSFSDSNHVYQASIESTLDEKYRNVLGDHALKVDGSGMITRAAQASISYFLDTSLNEEKGKLSIGAWGKSSGIPTTVTPADLSDGNNRTFRIRVDFVSEIIMDPWSQPYSSTIIKTDYINFNSAIDGWQYAYADVDMPDEDTYFVNVFFEYKGEGTVYFDGLQVFFDSQYTRYSYESMYGNLTAVESSSGGVTEYIYDEDKDYPSVPVEINPSTGSKVEITPSGEGQIESIKIANVTYGVTKNNYGQVVESNASSEGITLYTTSTAYTHLSQFVSSKTNEFGKTTAYYTDTLNGLLEAVSNAKGQDTHYLYDNEGKLIEVLSVEDYLNYTSGSEDAWVEYLYNSKDQLWKIVMGTNYYYEIEYDAQGRIESVFVNDQRLMNYTYIMRGTYYTDLISEQTYGNGDVIKFIYDDKDQVTSVQFKESTGNFVDKFSYIYDQSGRIAVYNTLLNGVIVNSEYYTYDSSGNLIRMTDLEGNEFSYAYDSKGNLTSLEIVLDGNTSFTNYYYEECLEEDGGVCTIPTELYDRTEYTTINQDVIRDYHYQSSALHRLDHISLIGDTFHLEQAFTYQGSTNRITVITYTINDGDFDYRYTYGFDDLGQITQEFYYEGYSIKLYRKYEYDDLNRLIVEDSRDYDVSATVLTETNFTKYYYYDDRGNITDIKTFLYGQDDIIPVTIPNYYQNSTGMMNLTMYYNGSNDYQDMYLLQVGQSPSLSFTYYDLTNETMVYGLTTNQTYSNLNVNKKGYYYRTYNVTDGYFYNLTFRIVFKVGDPTESERTPLEHIRYHYNTTWDDQLMSYGDINYVGGVPQAEVSLQAYIYDAQGNPIQITNFIFDGVVYHHADLSWSGRALSEIKIYTTGSSIPIGVITYQYNDQGYRTSKTIDRGSIGIQTIVYTLIGSNVIYETDGTYGLTYTYDVDQSIIGFTYDPNVNASGDEEDYFFLHNQMRDVTHILDSEGNTIVHYAYDAFGNIIKTEVTSGYGAIAELNPYTYRSYRYDHEIDWYYLNSRYYNPEIMRFISSDGLLGQMGDILSTNMYAYCGNNPVMYIDPSGESFIFALGIGFLLGAIIGGGFETASQISDNGFILEDWDWGQIGLSALGGGIAGMISAIPIGGTGVLSYLASFGIGGLASVSGGLISGSVSFSEPSTIILSFVIGGVANVLARGISSKINKMVADKAKNTLQNSFAFSNMKLSDLVGTGLSNNGLNPAYLKLANEAARLVAYSNGAFTKSIVYSSINSSLSSLFSGWY